MAANPTTFRDAELTNNSDRSAQIYKDINLNFSRHPVTGDIGMLSDAQAVKNSVRNLVNTNFYEKHFRPEIGSNIRSILFEPVSPLVADVLKRHVKDVIENFEPRAELIDIKSIAKPDRNEYQVTIEFFVVNSSTGVESVTLMLEQLR
jgi:phage baseplate assembly protein W|tara:strand:- start:603 stop:1046 length:444 start_codon:yes stop_codon:yes gene_type:complete